MKIFYTQLFKLLSHQDGVPTASQKIQNVDLRAVETQVPPRQRSGIASERGEIA